MAGMSLDMTLGEFLKQAMHERGAGRDILELLALASQAPALPSQAPAPEAKGAPGLVPKAEDSCRSVRTTEHGAPANAARDCAERGGAIGSSAASPDLDALPTPTGAALLSLPPMDECNLGFLDALGKEALGDLDAMFPLDAPPQGPNARGMQAFTPGRAGAQGEGGEGNAEPGNVLARLESLDLAGLQEALLGVGQMSSQQLDSIVQAVGIEPGQKQVDVSQGEGNAMAAAEDPAALVLPAIKTRLLAQSPAQRALELADAQNPMLSSPKRVRVGKTALEDCERTWVPSPTWSEEDDTHSQQTSGSQGSQGRKGHKMSTEKKRRQRIHESFSRLREATGTKGEQIYVVEDAIRKIEQQRKLIELLKAQLANLQ